MWQIVVLQIVDYSRSFLQQYFPPHRAIVQPNNFRGKEFCVRVGHTNEPGTAIWNDAQCKHAYSFVCSGSSGPTTVPTTQTIVTDGGSGEEETTQPLTPSTVNHAESTTPVPTTPETTTPEPTTTRATTATLPPETEPTTTTATQSTPFNPECPSYVGTTRIFVNQALSWNDAAEHCHSVFNGYLTSYYSAAALASAYAEAQGAGASQFWTGGHRKSDTSQVTKDEKFEWISWGKNFQSKSCQAVATGFEFIEPGVIAPPLNKNNKQYVDKYQTYVLLRCSPLLYSFSLQLALLSCERATTFSHRYRIIFISFQVWGFLDFIAEVQ